MPPPVQLSVILTTHTDRSHFDSLLLTLTRMSHPGLELIILNDAAGSEISDSIRKVVESSKNDRIYFLEHDAPKGRGSCLNEGLSQAAGSLIWAPLKAERLNETLITDFIRRFRSEPLAFWTLDYSLPEDSAAWAGIASDGNLPDDTCFVWNRSVIKAKDLFFNPYMESLHGSELALRLCGDYTWHQTDPFFVLSEQQSIFASDSDSRELLITALRLSSTPESRGEIIEKLKKLDAGSNILQGDEQFLIEARRFLHAGDANKALEQIHRYLRKYPTHYEANRIKITSLEKLRRHVEAAELKHALQKMRLQPEPETKKTDHQNQKTEPAANNPANDTDPETDGVSDTVVRNEFEPDNPSGSKDGISDVAATPFGREKGETEHREINVSIIIPTAAAGKQLLEGVLMRLEEVADPQTTELIVIDNASIDDTFRYLEQLEQDRFLNLKLITNQTNRGFAASVNSGMNKASGNYLLVMHNDVILGAGTIEALTEAFDNHDNLAMAVPVLNVSDVAEQVSQQGESSRYIPLTKADSCCFMIRNNFEVEFDDEYRLCHFEMQDYCMQLQSKGKNIVAVSSAHAEHHPAQTTTMMGAKLVPHLKWANRDRFHRKWGTPPNFEIPLQGSHPERFQKLGVPDDPLNPDMKWVDAIQKYITNEVKTEILRTKWSESDLITIVTAMLVADERELLRTLEDRIDNTELPVPLLILFIEYYFSKNIYSRCRHYLNKGGNRHPSFDLYRIKIMVAEKETHSAAPLLTEMLESYPANPDLLYLAGDLYRQSGDEDEAKSFYALASQVDPFRFSNEEVEFEI